MEDSFSSTISAICNAIILVLFVVMLCMVGQININLDNIKNNININTTETIQINGKEYKQIKEENTEAGKKVYYIIKQEKSDVKNINIE